MSGAAVLLEAIVAVACFALALALARVGARRPDAGFAIARRLAVASLVIFGVTQALRVVDARYPLGEFVRILPFATGLAAVAAIAVAASLWLELDAAVARLADRNARRFRIAFDAAPNGFLMVDDRGRITMANERLARMLGHSVADLHGRSVEDLLPPAARAAHVRERTAYHARPTERPMGARRVLTAARADGTTLPVEIGLSPVEIDGRPMVLASIVDVSERLRILRELESKTRELERSNRELEMFAYVASHDLQEPLRMVTSYVQLLARRYRGRLDRDADEFIGFALDGANRMRTLIGDLLAYASVESGGRELAPCETNEALQRALANLRATIEAAGAEVSAVPLPRVWGDVAQIARLFENLIGNAIKYRSEAPPRIAIDCEPEGAMWRFDVSDNGIGIPPEFRERVFVIFQRLHSREAYPGTGIGLAICQRIVERHGGWIRAEPASGGGSVFRFTLPAVPA